MWLDAGLQGSNLTCAPWMHHLHSVKRRGVSWGDGERKLCLEGVCSAHEICQRNLNHRMRLWILLIFPRYQKQPFFPIIHVPHAGGIGFNEMEGCSSFPLMQELVM